MANSKLIIIEGPQGTGKTSITDYIRYSIPYTNLYRLNGTNDNTVTGLEKSKKMYNNLLDYMKTLENCSVNLVFDRTFFSEETYCRLGYKEYSFTEVYKELLKKLNELDFEIYYITLYLKDTKIFEERLKRDDKAKVKYAQFNVNSSINQQNEYLKISDEVKEKCSNIKVFKVSNDNGFDEFKKEIIDIINNK